MFKINNKKITDRLLHVIVQFIPTNSKESFNLLG